MERIYLGRQAVTPPAAGTKRKARKRGKSRFGQIWRNNVRPIFSRPLSKLAALIVPHIYLGYMRFVWATSRIQPGNFLDLKRIIAEHNGAVGLLWHEEVMTVAFGYAYLGFRPHTLASLGEAGEVITRMSTWSNERRIPPGLAAEEPSSLAVSGICTSGT